MQLHTDDDAFIRAPAGLVYRLLTDIGSWPGWWPGTRADRVEDVDGEAWELRLGSRLRVDAVPGDWRHDEGFRLSVTGDLDGVLEFWLEPTDGGTVVHVILHADTAARRPLRVLARFRRAVRAGLWSFKDEVQGQLRTALEGLS